MKKKTTKYVQDRFFSYVRIILSLKLILMSNKIKNKIFLDVPIINPVCNVRFVLGRF